MKILNYSFNNEKLLDLALTQSGADSAHNNERLEFIGDRVLGLSVAVLLYEMFPNEAEGELARRHATLVSTDTLAIVAGKIGLEKHIRHGHMTAGRTKHILADAMEAVFGAIYLDAGFDVARDIIIDIWRELAAAEIVAPKDAKTALQEFVQKIIRANCRYMNICPKRARRTARYLMCRYLRWGNRRRVRAHLKNRHQPPPPRNY